MKKVLLIILLVSPFITNGQSLKEALDRNSVILCAHRGGMYAEYAENSLRTLSSLEDKFRGAPVMAEVDVRKSKDGTLFLMHDATLERTTNGTGTVDQSTDEYLQSLKLKTSNGRLTEEKIPTLDELLDFIADRRIFLMLDVKIDDWQLVLDQVRKKKATNKCLVLTFKPENSRIVSTLDPDILVSCLVRDDKDLTEVRSIVRRNMLAYVGRATPAEVIEKMRDLRIPMVTDASEVTTNNSAPYDPDFYLNLVESGVKVFVTDLPVEVQRFLSK